MFNSSKNIIGTKQNYCISQTEAHICRTARICQRSINSETFSTIKEYKLTCKMKQLVWTFVPVAANLVVSYLL